MLRIQCFCRFLAWVLTFAIILLSIVPAHNRPVTPLPHNLEHLGMFILTGTAFGTGYRKYFLFSAVAVIAFSGFIELIQLFLPDRHARWGDFIIDACKASRSALLWALSWYVFAPTPGTYLSQLGQAGTNSGPLSPFKNYTR